MRYFLPILGVITYLIVNSTSLTNLGIAQQTSGQSSNQLPANGNDNKPDESKGSNTPVSGNTHSSNAPGGEGPCIVSETETKFTVRYDKLSQDKVNRWNGEAEVQKGDSFVSVKQIFYSVYHNSDARPDKMFEGYQEVVRCLVTELDKYGVKNGRCFIAVSPQMGYPELRSSSSSKLCGIGSDGKPLNECNVAGVFSDKFNWNPDDLPVWGLPLAIGGNCTNSLEKSLTRISESYLVNATKNSDDPAIHFAAEGVRTSDNDTLSTVTLHGQKEQRVFVLDAPNADYMEIRSVSFPEDCLGLSDNRKATWAICSGSDVQKWTIDSGKIQNKAFNNNYCLRAGDPIVLSECKSNASFAWCIFPQFEMRLSYSRFSSRSWMENLRCNENGFHSFRSNPLGAYSDVD